MVKNTIILLVAGIVIALPFLLRRAPDDGNWKPGDPVLVVISPHNEAIRYEFARGFSLWHEEEYGTAVKIDWRVIGGTSQIMRYLESQYVAAFKAWWQRQGGQWPAEGADLILDRRFDPSNPPQDPRERAKWDDQKAMWTAFRQTDSAEAFSCKVDIFFGGGVYDHDKAGRQGLGVAPWTNGVPAGLFSTDSGASLIPEAKSGETWRGKTYFGTALSTFGICYNFDRLEDLGLDEPPDSWQDLGDTAYRGQLGMADPTKSGSTAKAFEMIIHEQCHKAVREAGYTGNEVAAFEQIISEAGLPMGEMPEGVPAAYQEAVEKGWRQGILLIRRIGGNARYFTESAGKVPIDVSMGNAAAGLAIDFYGRYQAETSRDEHGEPHMAYLTPVGGSSVSADPISLLRGAPHRELGTRFIEFVLSEAGQRLWNYKPGTPGGPHKFALRRLPIRRDFYPSEKWPEIQAAYERHAQHTVDPLGDPEVNPYLLAEAFTYYSRWTGRHFSVHRDLIRAMCLDAGQELRAAWNAIHHAGGLTALPEVMDVFNRFPGQPEPLTWSSAISIRRANKRIDYKRDWTIYFRGIYREAESMALSRGMEATR